MYTRKRPGVDTPGICSIYPNLMPKLRFIKGGKEQQQQHQQQQQQHQQQQQQQHQEQ